MDINTSNLSELNWSSEYHFSKTESIQCINTSNGWIYDTSKNGEISIYQIPLPCSSPLVSHSSGCLPSSPQILPIRSSNKSIITSLCICPPNLMDFIRVNTSNIHQKIDSLLIGVDSGDVWIHTPSASKTSFIHSHLISSTMGRPMKIICCNKTNIIFTLYDSGEVTCWKFKTSFKQYFPRIPGAFSICLQSDEGYIAIASRDRELYLFKYPEERNSEEKQLFEVQPIFKREIFKKSSLDINLFQMNWHPNRLQLLLPGELNIRLLDVSSSNVTTINNAGHQQDICYVSTLMVNDHAACISIGTDKLICISSLTREELLFTVKAAVDLRMVATSFLLDSIFVWMVDCGGRFCRLCINDNTFDGWISLHQQNNKSEEEVHNFDEKNEENRNVMNAETADDEMSEKLEKRRNEGSGMKFVDDEASDEEDAFIDDTIEESDVSSSSNDEEREMSVEEGREIFDEVEEEEENHPMGVEEKADVSTNIKSQQNWIYEKKLKELQQEMKRLKTMLSKGVEQPIVTPGRYSSCPTDGSKPWCLFWTSDGHITKRSDESGSTIEVFEKNTEPKRRRDVYGCTTAALSTSGYALGSPSPPESVAPSIIEYHAFVEGNGAAIGMWEKRLPLSEDVVCLAVGVDFVAALTSLCYLRIYSSSGMVLSLTRIKGQPISLAANKNLLFVLTKSSTSMSGSTAGEVDTVFQYQLLRVSSPKDEGPSIVLITEGEFGIEGTSLVRWVNISDIGMPAIMDTTGEVYGLLPSWKTTYQHPSFQWSPLCNLIEATSDGNYTYLPIHIQQINQNYEHVQVIRIEEGQSHPSCTTSSPFFGYQIERLPIRLPECNVGLYEKWRRSHHRDASYIRSDEALELPWEQFDEVRHRINMRIQQIQIAKEYGYAVEEVNSFKQMAEHESVIIRMFTKIIDNWKLVDLAVETAMLMKLPQTFEKAFSQCLNPKNYNHKRVIRELQRLKGVEGGDTKEPPTTTAEDVGGSTSSTTKAVVYRSKEASQHPSSSLIKVGKRLSSSNEKLNSKNEFLEVDTFSSQKSSYLDVLFEEEADEGLNKRRKLKKFE